MRGQAHLGFTKNFKIDNEISFINLNNFNYMWDMQYKMKSSNNNANYLYKKIIHIIKFSITSDLQYLMDFKK